MADQICGKMPNVNCIGAIKLQSMSINYSLCHCELHNLNIMILLIKYGKIQIKIVKKTKYNIGMNFVIRILNCRIYIYINGHLKLHIKIVE